jgi:hypothetical protein
MVIKMNKIVSDHDSELPWAFQVMGDRDSCKYGWGCIQESLPWIRKNERFLELAFRVELSSNQSEK